MIINIKEWKVGDTFKFAGIYCMVVEVCTGNFRILFANDRSDVPYGRIINNSEYSIERISYKEFMEYEERVENEI